MMPVVITPLVTSLVTGLAMYLLLDAPLAWVMTTLQVWLTSMSGGSALLLGLILGAMMASDLGGPINKAAYLFATAGLSLGCDRVTQEIMAAVIISGMVPPLAMASWPPPCAQALQRGRARERQSRLAAGCILHLRGCYSLRLG